MRKFIKKVLAIATVATMAVSTAFTSFAATGWQYNDVNKTWAYLEYDEPVVDEWHKSGDHMFYLNEDGVMAVSTIVENNNGTLSYVNEDGARVANTWVWAEIPNEDGEQHWVYIKANGQSEDNGWATINGKKYHFTDNVMDYGFLDADGNMIDEDVDDAWIEATYYCGAEADGARYSGWVEVFSTDTDEYDNYDTIWIYFDSNGKKVTDTIKTINGVKYQFDENGVMVQEWYVASSSNATPSNATYFDEDGAQAKNEWVYTTAENDENGEEHWYYFMSNGKMVTNDVKKINGKYYAFDENGVMLTGFVAVDEKGENPVAIGAADEITAENLMYLDSDYMYFEEDGGSIEGQAYTGKEKIELEDDVYTIMFSNRGVSKDAIKQDGYLYINGVLQTADEDGEYSYEAIEVEKGAYLIVNKNGKILTKDHTDKESTKWIFEDGVAKHMEKNDDTKKYDIVLDEYPLFK